MPGVSRPDLPSGSPGFLFAALSRALQWTGWYSQWGWPPGSKGSKRDLRMQRMGPGASPDHGDGSGPPHLHTHKASLLWYACQPVSLHGLLFEIKLRRWIPSLGKSTTYLLTGDFPQRVLSLSLILPGVESPRAHSRKAVVSWDHCSDRQEARIDRLLFCGCSWFCLFCDRVSWIPGWPLTQCTAKDNLELLIPLHPPSQCLDYRHGSPCPI